MKCSPQDQRRGQDQGATGSGFASLPQCLDLKKRVLNNKIATKQHTCTSQHDFSDCGRRYHADEVYYHNDIGSSLLYDFTTTTKTMMMNVSMMLNMLVMMEKIQHMTNHPSLQFLRCFCCIKLYIYIAKINNLADPRCW